VTTVDRFPVPGSRLAIACSARRECCNREPATQCSAFTLAETLFAMAIVSFTLLTIIGLMPTALDELRQSERRAAEARILQSLAADYELLPWTELQNLGRRGPFFYDETGLARRSMDESTRYLAEVSDSQITDADRRLPGENGSPSPFLKQLRISITDRVQDTSALGSNADDGKKREFYLRIAKHDAERGEVAP